MSSTANSCTSTVNQVASAPSNSAIPEQSKAIEDKNVTSAPTGGCIINDSESSVDSSDVQYPQQIVSQQYFVERIVGKRIVNGIVSIKKRLIFTLISIDFIYVQFQFIDRIRSKVGRI